MSWEKIEDHLFDRYCVEGEDKELCNLMQEHDAEVRAKAVDEFAEKLKEEYAPYPEADDIDVRMYKMVCKRIDMVAQQVKEGGKDD